jgi:hypothetical protein
VSDTNEIEDTSDSMAAETPHVIHYCWFGGNPLGVKEQACINSWKKFLPGYEIKRWDESNWDVRCCDYVSEAYDAKKWAFVSDYARLDILYRHGGLYFDTDVELIKPIADILRHGPFMGFETDWSEKTDGTVNPGLGLASYSGLGLYKQILDSYQCAHFLKADGTFDTTTIVSRTTKILLENGLEPKAGIQEIEGITIYPSEYFNPKDFLTGIINLTENTRSIHHFSMSWLTDEYKFEHDVGAWLLNHHVHGPTSKIAALVTVIRYGDFKRLVRKLGLRKTERIDR